ncbi:hypothetical protein J6590_046047 [Homalodisca vitripennis]|nr:hypothetical protein J6590_046047 [Homalodisca vitripennis]
MSGRPFRSKWCMRICSHPYFFPVTRRMSGTVWKPLTVKLSFRAVYPTFGLSRKHVVDKDGPARPATDPTTQSVCAPISYGLCLNIEDMTISAPRQRYREILLAIYLHLSGRPCCLHRLRFIGCHGQIRYACQPLCKECDNKMVLI